MVGLVVLALRHWTAAARPLEQPSTDLTPFTTTAERGVLRGDHRQRRTAGPAEGERESAQAGLLDELLVDEEDVVEEGQVLAVMIAAISTIGCRRRVAASRSDYQSKEFERRKLCQWRDQR